MSATPNGEVDLAIVGGGIAGAALGALAASEGRIAPERICILESQPPLPPRAGEPLDARVSAFTPSSLALLSGLGVLEKLDPARIADCERMVVWQEDVPAESPESLVFDAAELGEPRLGAIIENRAVQAGLLARCEALGVRVLRGRLEALELRDGRAMLSTSIGALQTALVAGADGADSAVRAAAGIPVREHSYHSRAIVAMVRASRTKAATAFQCFLSSGPLALLPLPDGAYSIVWSASEARAAQLMGLEESAFNAELTRAADGVVGDLQLAGSRLAFPLRRLAATRYAAPCCVLLGDAAHVIHPLAGQGVNQGMLDAEALTAALSMRAAGESPGAARALRAYERERRSGNALMGSLVDALDGLFSRGHARRARMAGMGMGLVGSSGLARRFLFTQAAGGRPSPRR